MTAQRIDGYALATQIRRELKSQVDKLKNQGKPSPGLAVILVGHDPASKIYVHHKRIACQEVGMYSVDYDLPSHISEHELLDLIDELNENPLIHGILVQLPLPPHLNTEQIIERTYPNKDVDGFHPYNLGRLAQKNPFLRPCTPYGIIQLLHYIEADLVGLNAVIVGASNIVGKPMALELLMAESTVTICHHHTRDLEEHVKHADLLVAAIGHANVIQSKWIKPNAIVVDVGMNRLPDGKIVGDIDFDTAKDRASWITPVPGGVGPMTVASLLQNVFTTYFKQTHPELHHV